MGGVGAQYYIFHILLKIKAYNYLHYVQILKTDGPPFFYENPGVMTSLCYFHLFLRGLVVPQKRE